MKVLLTGATGFLGKRILRLLIEEPRVTRIVVISRRPRLHTSPKVEVLQIDLASPLLQHPQEGAAPAFPEVDAVIHLAGLYDFQAPLASAYRDNVLATLHLAAWIRNARGETGVPIHFASTYATVANDRLLEAPLPDLPPQARAYSHTKALAERALENSGLPLRVLRLGILVGDRASGEIEKFDGPYAFARLTHTLGKLPSSRWLRTLPIPADPAAPLPLVPVDLAAQVFARSLFLPAPIAGSPEHYGVFSNETITVSQVVDLLLERYLPRTRPWYLGDRLPTPLLKAQALLTRIPAETFHFASRRLQLDSERFAARFPECRVPRLEEYSKALIEGFERHVGGGSNP